MTPDEIAGLFLADIEPWYESRRDAKGNVNRNVMTVGLIMVDHMATAFPHNPSTYQTDRGSVRGLRGRRIGQILERHGEMRPISVEFGGTSRGTLDLAVQLADVC